MNINVILEILFKNEGKWHIHKEQVIKLKKSLN